MSDSAGEYLKIQPIPDVQRESLFRGDILYQDSETRIYYPDNPLVPASEGIHIRVESSGVPIHPKSPEEWKGWLRHWAKTIGVGKVVSEGAALPDMWQSFIGQTEYSPEGHVLTEVIGRNPEGESWTKTAPIPDVNYDNRSKRLPKERLEQVGATLTRYFNEYWIPSLKEGSLFAKQPAAESRLQPHFIEHEEWSKAPSDARTETVFASDDFDIVAATPPHLRSGLHLMVAMARRPVRPWRDLPTALEGLAVAEATAQLLEETQYQGKPLAAWTSVRATGSWFGGFTTLKDDVSYGHVPKKWLERKYRGVGSIAGPGADWKEMFFHTHIYGAREKDELIRLTTRPVEEGGEDWKNITPMSGEKRTFIRTILKTKLLPLLSGAKGKIAS